MKRNKMTGIAACYLLLFAACKQTGTSPHSPDRDAASHDTTHVINYTHPVIPPMMTDPQQKAAYYVRHYWDSYSLADTAFIHSDETEQLYADFIGALQYVEAAEQRLALQNMMSLMEADSTAYTHFCLLSEKYLYNPNSPMRCEEYYIPVLEQMVHSERLSEWEKIRPADRLKQARKNRPGMKAADFSYVTPDGKQARMSRLAADYTLLFFYDPDCSNCRKHEKILSEIPAFVKMQEDGILRVLAVYPDEDKDEWLRNASHMPRHWITGWNKQGDIRSRQLYDILATPTLYLLDKQKKVILKDASLENIIRYLAATEAKEEK